MKRFLIVILVIVALVAGGVIGWYVRGTATSAPSAATNGNSSGVTTTSGRCAADGLTGKIATAEGGAAAGSRYYTLTLTNASASTCTLDGYPGVSFTDSTGTMVGQPADKDTGSSANTVSLSPGATTTATIRLAQSGAYPDGTCKDGVTTLKIYPPNDTGYLSVPTDSVSITTWCPGFTTTALSAS